MAVSPIQENRAKSMRGMKRGISAEKRIRLHERVQRSPVKEECERPSSPPLFGQSMPLL